MIIFGFQSSAWGQAPTLSIEAKQEPIQEIMKKIEHQTGMTFSYDPSNASAVYDNAQAIYIGANWYVIPAVKVPVGYEWGEYTGKVNAQAENRTQSNTVRASLQVLF